MKRRNQIDFSIDLSGADRLGRLLEDPFENRREDIWLWLYLYRDFDFPPETCNGLTMRDEIADALETSKETRKKLRSLKDKFLIPRTNLDWIKEDKRQHEWLLPRLNEIRKRPLDKNLINLSGRNRIIATIDNWYADVTDKAVEVERLRRSWFRHIRKDSRFEWFADRQYSKKRCACAWEWLQKKYLPPISSQPPISNYEELLIFFDKANLGSAEQSAIIQGIKKRWSQKKYEERTADKKQLNVKIPITVISQLDTLSNQHDLKRAEIVERLIRMEAEKGVYLHDD